MKKTTFFFSVFAFYLLFGFSTAHADITSNLKGWWRFDEGSGTTTTDSSESGNTGTLVNAPEWVVGKIGQGLKFDGSTNYVKVPYASSLYSTAMTVSFWVKSNITNYTTNASVVNMWDYVANKRVWAVFVNQGTDKWQIFTSVNGTSNSAEDTNKSVQTGWHHIAVVTSNAGDTWTFYYDGTTSGTITSTGAYTNQSSFVTIGGLDGINFINGSMDDVRIYNRALSASDVLELYNWSGTTTPATVDFKVQNSTGSTTLQLLDNGNLGIGTTSPTEKLVINGNVLARSYLTFSPYFSGDALASIGKIKIDSNTKKIDSDWGDVDHNTLPDQLFSTSSLIIKEPSYYKGKLIYPGEIKEIQTQDLTKTTAFLLRSIQQIIEQSSTTIAILNNQINDLQNRIMKLENTQITPK